MDAYKLIGLAAQRRIEAGIRFERRLANGIVCPLDVELLAAASAIVAPAKQALSNVGLADLGIQDGRRRRQLRAVGGDGVVGGQAADVEDIMDAPGPGKAEAVGTGIDDGSRFEVASKAGLELVGWALGKGSVGCGEEDTVTDAEAELAAAAVSMLALAVLGGG